MPLEMGQRSKKIPIWKKNINLQIQETEESSNRINQKKSTIPHSLVKFLKEERENNTLLIREKLLQ